MSLPPTSDHTTLNPRAEASRELRELSLQLKYIDKESWIFTLNHWHKKWESYLKEKNINPVTGKWFYTHKRLRSAYRSLRVNTPYLFTYQS